jgi:hypothetical protein
MFAILAFYGVYLAAAVAASVGGTLAALGSVLVVVPLLYWPLHAAAGGDWWPMVSFYGGWTGVMMCWALYEMTLEGPVAKVIRLRKPR